MNKGLNDGGQGSHRRDSYGRDSHRRDSHLRQGGTGPAHNDTSGATPPPTPPTPPALPPTPTPALVAGIQRVGRLLVAAAAQTCAPYGIGPGEYEILARLLAAGPPHRLTPGQLASDGVAPATTTTSRLDRLQRAQLIVRRPDPANGRSLHVLLTPDGRALTEQLVRKQAERERVVFDEIEAGDRQRLAAVLDRLAGRLTMQLSQVHDKTGRAASG